MDDVGDDAGQMKLRRAGRHWGSGWRRRGGLAASRATAEWLPSVAALVNATSHALWTSPWGLSSGPFDVRLRMLRRYLLTRQATAIPAVGG